jgi:sortase A
MFGFVAYQLWGTGIETARAQRALESNFEEQLARVDPLPAPRTEPPLEPPTASADADPEANTEADSGTGVGLDDPITETEPAPEESGTSAPAAVPLANQNLPAVENGDAIARLEIPSIGVNDIIVAGVGTSDLKKGPGHYPDTPLPGQLGNAAIAGHRTTYGQPFFDVDKLEPGDEIIVTTLSGRFVYRVTGQEIVDPSDYGVVATVNPDVANLTLTSCNPKWTAQQRIVIFSELDQDASTSAGEPVLNYGRDLEEIEAAAGTGDDGPLSLEDDPVLDGPVTAEQSVDDPPESDESAPDEAGGTVGANDGTGTPAGDADVGSAVPGSAVANAGIADAFAEGWFSDPGAPLHVGLWALLLAAIGALAYLISRSLRRVWAGALIAVIPFLVTLYFFYQNVNRLLPPNL